MRAVSPPADRPSLLRAVSRWQIVAVSIDSVIGSGVYLLPARAAALLGAASLAAVPLAGLCVFLIVLCFAEAGSRFDRPGGAYVYTREAFGDFIGFEIGWMTWLARIAASATLSAAFADALAEWWPASAAGGGRAAAVLLVLGFLTAINIAGVKYGARTSVLVVIGKVLPLVVLISIGIFAVDCSRIDPLARPPLDGRLVQAALLLLFAYAGFENTAAPAGEYKNPQRDVPFALFVMIGSATLIYTLAQLVALSLVPDLAHAPRPLAAAGRVLLGPFGGALLTIGGLVAVIGTNNGAVLAGPRYLYPLAESGRVPRFFASVHPRLRTPWIAILTQSALVVPLALSGSFVELAQLSIIARMAAYMGTAASVPFLRRKLPSGPHTIRLPGGPAIPIATLAVCTLLLSQAKASNLIAAAIALAVGTLIYGVHARRLVDHERIEPLEIDDNP